MTKRLKLTRETKQKDPVLAELEDLQQRYVTCVNGMQKMSEIITKLQGQIMTMKEEDDKDFLSNYDSIYVDVRMLDKTVITSRTVFGKQGEKDVITNQRPEDVVDGKTYRVVIK